MVLTGATSRAIEEPSTRFSLIHKATPSLAPEATARFACGIWPTQLWRLWQTTPGKCWSSHFLQAVTGWSHAHRTHHCAFGNGRSNRLEFFLERVARTLSSASRRTVKGWLGQAKTHR